MLRNAVAFTALMAVSAGATALEIACPETISTTQQLKKAASGWEGFVRPSEPGKAYDWSRVTRIDLYTGHPRGIAQLKPDDENAVEDSWTFSSPSTPNEPLYMSCI